MAEHKNEDAGNSGHEGPDDDPCDSGLVVCALSANIVGDGLVDRLILRLEDFDLLEQRGYRRSP